MRVRHFATRQVAPGRREFPGDKRVVFRKERRGAAGLRAIGRETLTPAWDLQLSEDWTAGIPASEPLLAGVQPSFSTAAFV